MLVHSSKNENKQLMPIVKLLFKSSWVICLVMHIRKTENDGTSLRE